MKEGYRFVDCDMHIMEPVDLFEKYLDPAFRHRVTSSPRPTNSLDGAAAALVLRRSAPLQ